ncbi:MAG TPA: PP2C family serine/threonine-protein phosphatase [Burkholderiaceae bacterium]|nr:PP2C family serine/threonine-protein phosphatase [Burkholderiaceae bacterium]
MRFSIFQDSLIGGRSINQDRMGYCFTRESLLMLVADGMGGHVRGEVAAQLTLQTVAGMFQRAASPRLPDPVAFLDSALRASHRELIRYQLAHDLQEAPRTTVVACIVQEGHAWWAHAGDSRLYWLRGGRVIGRTRDHSKVQTMVALGLISSDEQESHPERNKVLNCLGSPAEPTVEIGSRARLEPGDVLVLCSDGLWSGVSDAQLAREFDEAPLARVVPGLVRRAIAANGRLADNTTVVALGWEGGDLGDELPTLSSLNLPEGAITTTISIAPPADEQPVDLSEEEIERTIAEIQQAIQRSNGSAS